MDDKMTALYAALAVAQGQFRPIVKNRSVQIRMKSGGSYAFRYADLEEITSATRPALAANGLSIIHPLNSDEANGKCYMQTILAHSGGGVIVSRIELPAPTSYSDPKEFGAASSYLRRYAVSSLLGIAADDDLDEDGRAMGEGAGATDADAVGALVDGLIAGAKATTTDADALAFWKGNAAKLAKYPNAFEELKQAVANHRKALAQRATEAA